MSISILFGKLPSYDGRFNPQIVEQIRRHGICLEFKEALPVLDARDLTELIRIQMNIAAYDQLLKGKERRVDEHSDDCRGTQEVERPLEYAS